MKLTQKKLKDIVEGALLAAGRPLSLDELAAIFEDGERPTAPQLKKALGVLDK